MLARTSVSRLLALATFLETLPRKRFFYGDVVGCDWEGKPDLSCGTTACAIGWATTMPRFRRLGLRLTEAGTCKFPGSRSDLYDHVAAELFGICLLDATFLFTPSYGNGEYTSPDWKATPKQVAKHIRKFVANRWPTTKES